MSNSDPLVIVDQDGYRMIVPMSRFADELQARGFVLVRRVYADEDDDLGAWDNGPMYLIAHEDGTRYAVTYNNWLYRYQGVGFALIGLEVPVDETLVIGGVGTFDFSTPDNSGLLAFVL